MRAQRHMRWELGLTPKALAVVLAEDDDDGKAASAMPCDDAAMLRLSIYLTFFDPFLNCSSVPTLHVTDLAVYGELEIRICAWFYQPVEERSRNF